MAFRLARFLQQVFQDGSTGFRFVESFTPTEENLVAHKSRRQDVAAWCATSEARESAMEKRADPPSSPLPAGASSDNPSTLDTDAFVDAFIESYEDVRLANFASLIIAEAPTIQLGNPEQPTPLEEALLSIGVPWSVFTDHKQHTTSHSNDRPPPPTRHTPAHAQRVRSCLQYFELWEFMGKTEQLQYQAPRSKKICTPGDGGLTMYCEETGAQVQCHRFHRADGEKDEDGEEGRGRGRVENGNTEKESTDKWLFVFPRKCSFFHLTENGRNDLVILCDPAPYWGRINDVRMSLRPMIPYDRGYQNLMPNSTPTVIADPRELTSQRPNPESLRDETVVMEKSDSNSSDECKGGKAADKDKEATTIDAREVSNSSRRPSGSSTSSERRKKYNLTTEISRGSPADLASGSMYNDLLYYLSNPSTRVGEAGFPLSAAVVPAAIILHHFQRVQGLSSSQVELMRNAGWAVNQRDDEQVREAQRMEATWASFKISHFMSAFEAVMRSFAMDHHHQQYYLPHAPGTQLHGVRYQGIAAASEDAHHPAGSGPPQDARRPAAAAAPQPYQPTFWGTPSSTCCPPQHGRPRHHLLEWTEVSASYRQLRQGFHDVRDGYDRLTVSAGTLRNIVAGRHGFEEARTAKTLTIVALIFIPLAWVAAVFSIPPELGPGGDAFWLYWAVAVPTTAATIAVWICFVRYWSQSRVDDWLLGVQWYWCWAWDAVRGRRGKDRQPWEEGVVQLEPLQRIVYE